MIKNKYYTSGQFARIANVTLRTIRYYDSKGLLKPSFVGDNGYRYYTDYDLIKLQQILLFKYLGFSLSEIKNMNLNDIDSFTLENALFVQKKLVQDQIQHMIKVEESIDKTVDELKANKEMNWDNMIDLIRLTSVSKDSLNQYKDASNLTIRINIHDAYSTNKIGWFNWIYDQLELSYYDKVLEVGCGDGSLWKGKSANFNITLSDISEGMVNDAKRNLGNEFNFQVIDCEDIPFKNNYFDQVIGNHLLFYVKHINQGLNEINRVLKKEGKFICSTYGKNHMKEIDELVKKFDASIYLSKTNLYECFGKENGGEFLKPYFSNVEWIEYNDSLIIDNADALIAYIVSCHGNQNALILPRYKEFKEFVVKEMGHGLEIMKEAGIFICKK